MQVNIIVVIAKFLIKRIFKKVNKNIQMHGIRNKKYYNKKKQVVNF